MLKDEEELIKMERKRKEDEDRLLAEKIENEYKLRMEGESFDINILANEESRFFEK